MKTGSSKEWNQKMQALRNHASPLNIDLAWRELEVKLHQKKKRRIFLFWFLLAGLASSFLITGMLVTTRPLYTRAAENYVEKNVKDANIRNQTKLLVNSGVISDKATKDIVVRTKLTKSDKKVNLKIHQEANIRTIQPINGKEVLITEAAKDNEERDDITMTERIEFVQLATPLSTLLPACNLQPEMTMPAVLYYTKPQNGKGLWWLAAQGGSGVQYFRYKDMSGEAGVVDRVKAIEKTGSIYQGRLGLGRDIGKRFYVSAGLSGFFASEEHTGIVVDTVIGFKENVLISSYKDHDGSVIEEYGNVMTTTVRQTTKLRYPGVNSLSVYLGIGKKWLVGKNMIQLEAAYQQRLLTSIWSTGINFKQEEVDFDQLYRLKSSSWMVDLNYSRPIYRNVWMRAGCLFHQNTLVSTAAYTRLNTSMSAQLGLAWALE